MTRPDELKAAIGRAKETLIGDRVLMAILNRTGEVRIPVLPELATAPRNDEPIKDEPVQCVRFTIEDTHFGKHLMAELDGYKEFAA